MRPSWSTTAAYIDSPWSRSASASRITSPVSSTGPSGESAVAGTVSPARSRWVSQPSGRSLVVDQQRVGDLDVGVVEFRPHLGGRLAGPRVRRPPEVDVADPHQREPLQRPVGADEVLDELVRRGHQDLGRGRVLLDPSVLLHDRDPVAHLDRLVDVVGDEEDRLADFGLQAEELVLQALAVDRVDRRRRARPSASPAGRRRALARPRPAAAGRRRAAPGSGRRGRGRARPGRAARSCGRGSAPCPSRAAAARWRCSGRSCGGGRGRSAGSRSRSPAAASPRRAASPTRRRSGCRPRSARPSG